MSEVLSGQHPIILKKNGDLILIDKEADTKTKIAFFNRKTGDLEYETADIGKAHARGCAFAVGTVNKGKTVSGLTIKTIGVKGEKRDDLSKAPPKPKKDPLLGDQTDELVRWYFAWSPVEAVRRYQVFLDAEGNMVRRKVRRKWVEFIDDRTDGLYGLEEQNDGKGQQLAKGKWEGGPVQQHRSLEVLDNQIIARRATCMTFHPNEVVGGFDASDDSDEQAAQALEESEVEADA
jgi:hypothetical protein